MSDQIKNNDKPFLDKVINSYVHPFIKPPFPPLIDPKDLITKSIIGNKPNRAPNAFIIYRKMYVREARNEGYCFPMTVLSSIVSQSWEKEPEEVKTYYKKLAKEAFEYRNELYPKPENKKKKRSNWNVISFEKNLEENNDISFKNKFNSTSSAPIQLSVSTDNLLVDNFDSINQISTPDLSRESSTTTSPIIDDPSTDELDTVFNSRNVYLDSNSISINESWKFNEMEYMNSFEQQLSFGNFQEINFYDQIIEDNQLQSFNVFQNQQQLNHCQNVNPNTLPSSSPDVLGIFECGNRQEFETALTSQPVYSNSNMIPDNTCVNQQYYNTSESLDYYSFH